MLYLIIALLFAGCATFAAGWSRARRLADVSLHDALVAREEMRRLVDALADRDEQDRVKDEFVSTVSHELRTPLTSIRGALGLLHTLLGSSIDAKSLNLLRIATSNTDRLVRLINDILDLERMDSGKAPLQRHPCALHELARHAMDTMGAMAEDAGVHLELVPEPEVIALEADPDRIQQVLCNLLSNAIKFSARGSVVRMLSGVDGNFAVLRVEDQGRGIPKDKLESVFDRFQQVEHDDSRNRRGSGLGLAICRAIMIQHAGSIWAVRNDTDSPTRVGSTFVLRIPRIATVDNLLTVSAIYRRPRIAVQPT